MTPNESTIIYTLGLEDKLAAGTAKMSGSEVKVNLDGYDYIIVTCAPTEVMPILDFVRKHGANAGVAWEAAGKAYIAYKVCAGKNRKSYIDRIAVLAKLLYDVSITDTIRVDGNLLYTPIGEYEKNSAQQIIRFADMVPDAPVRAAAYCDYRPAHWHVEDFLTSHGIAFFADGDKQYTHYILDKCPVCGHTSAHIIADGRGGFSYICAECDSTWEDFRRVLAPTPSEQVVMDRMSAAAYGWETPAQTSAYDAWFTPSEASKRGCEHKVYIKSGIKSLDDLTGGFALGETTILSGISSSGKSSLTIGFAAQAVEQGIKTMLYSGEETVRDVYTLYTRYVAGRDHLTQVGKRSNYEIHPGSGSFDTTFRDAVYSGIAKHADGLLWLYDGEAGGNEVVELLDTVERKIVDDGVKFIILDNMSIMDLDAYMQHGRDEYAAQKKLILEVRRIAKKHFVHIILVAHPRKTSAYIRPEDISGTGAIRNLADMIILLHRVNDDFKRDIQEYYHRKPAILEKIETDNAIGSVVELAKERHGGGQGSDDSLIPLYFDPATQRLRNSTADNYRFAWEREFDAMVEAARRK